MWVDMGSGNGLLLLGNKPLPEPILTQICVLPDETCQDITLSNVDPDLCHLMVSLGLNSLRSSDAYMCQ